MLDDVVEILVCPVCGHHLAADSGALRCDLGHSFDIARQGYVNLLSPKSHTGSGDTAEMIQSRDAFLERGHFGSIAKQLSGIAASRVEAGGIVLDVGSGPGYYLARLLDEVPQARGLALDISKQAARKAAKRHPHMSAIVADVWSALPIADDSISMITDVFAPRNAREFARILRPGAPLVIVAPTTEHLHEIAEVLSLLSIEEGKGETLAEAMDPYFDFVSRNRVTMLMELTRADVVAVSAMGPAARHSSYEEMVRAARELEESTQVTLSVEISVFDKKWAGDNQG